MPAQSLQFPLTGGISQKVAAEYTDPNSRLVDGQNVVFTHDGSAEKRNGMVAFSNTQAFVGDPVMGSPEKVFTRGIESLVTDGDGLFNYSYDAFKWSFRGNVPQCLATRSHIFTSANAGYVAFSVAEGGGTRVVTYRNWVAGNGTIGDIYASVYDTTTGQPIGPQLVVFTSNHINYNPRVVFQGGTFYLYWGDTSHNLWFSKYSGGTWTVGATVVTDLSGYFDVVPYSNGGSVLLVYTQTAMASANVRRLTLTSGNTIASSGIVYNAGAGSGNFGTHIAIKHDANIGRIAIAYDVVNSGTYTTSLTVYDSTFSTTWTVNSIGMTGFSGAFFLQFCTLVDASHVIVGGYDYSTAVPALYAQWNFVTASQDFQARMGSHGIKGGSSGGAPDTGTTAPLAEPFRVTTGTTTRVYIPVASGQTLNDQTSSLKSPPLLSCVLLDITTASPRAVAVSAARQVDWFSVPTQWESDFRLPVPTQITGTGATTIRSVIPINPGEELNALTWNAPSGNYLGRTYLDLCQWDFTGATSWQQVEVGGSLYLSGGIPSYDEGQSIREIGFLEWPSLNSSAAVTATGGLLGNGTYGYALVWADVDAAGLITRSAPYFVTATTGNTTSKVTLVVNTLSWSARVGDARAPVLEIYRTAVNGTTYQFLAATSINLTPGGTITYQDTVTDASIATNTVLYATGGILSAFNPPSGRCIARVSERLHILDDTGYVIYFSTPFGGGPESGDASYFNDALTMQFADEQLTAIYALDDKLIAFSLGHIWYILGNYPDNTGAGGSLQSTPIPSDVGAADWRSIVTVPDGAQAGGLMFQAPTGGIYLLSRGLGVSFVGKDVQDWTQGQTVLSATLAPASNQARFILSNGQIITYDYVQGRWARNPTYFQGNLRPLHAATISTTGGWVAAFQGMGSCVAAEESGYYDDGTAVGMGKSWVTSSVTIGVIKPGGLQGWATLGLVSFLARWLDAADLTMTLTFDYGTASQTATFTHAALVAANSVMAQAAMWPQAANSSAVALQVTLSDATAADNTSVTGQGVRWLGVAVDVIPLPSLLNIPSSVRA